jgi:hypothetical protein
MAPPNKNEMLQFLDYLPAVGTQAAVKKRELRHVPLATHLSAYLSRRVVRKGVCVLLHDDGREGHLNFVCGAIDRLWPITSISQFGPGPLLVEPDMTNLRHPLLNNLVGRGQQRFWDGEAEGLGGLDVDDEFELGRLQDGQVSGLGAVKDFAGIDAALT